MRQKWNKLDKKSNYISQMPDNITLYFLSMLSRTLPVVLNKYCCVIGPTTNINNCNS